MYKDTTFHENTPMLKSKLSSLESGECFQLMNGTQNATGVLPTIFRLIRSENIAEGIKVPSGFSICIPICNTDNTIIDTDAYVNIFSDCIDVRRVSIDIAVRKH